MKENKVIRSIRRRFENISSDGFFFLLDVSVKNVYYCNVEEKVTKWKKIISVKKKTK